MTTKIQDRVRVYRQRGYSTLIEAGLGFRETPALLDWGLPLHFFEPDEANFNRVSKKLEALHAKHVKLYRAALLDFNGDIELTRSKDADGHSISSNIPTKIGTMMVPAIDIADIVREYGPIAFLAMNIEGSEYRVIERLIATGLIDKIGVIGVEWHKRLPDLEKEYNRLFPMWQPHKDKFVSWR